MTTPPNDDVRVCLFEVAGHSFGVRLESVQEVVPMAALSRPPAMPALFEGFLNRRGAAIPVLRTASVFGLPQDALELHTPLVIVRGVTPLALLVNRVTGIVTCPPGALVPAAESDSFNGCIDGRLTTASGSAHMLSLDRLLLEKERRTLAEFQATEISRLRQLDQERS
jgi:purine-binding chemotaxis protein CheW